LSPPADAFWHRYSRNSEFPFSTLASICIHGAVLIVLLAGVWAWGSHDRALVDMNIISTGDGPGDPGGGGDTMGQGTINPGNLGPTEVKEDLFRNDPKPDPSFLAKRDDVNVKVVGPALEDDPIAEKIVEKMRQKAPIALIGPQIRDAIAGIPGLGKGGKGSGGGNGDGKGIHNGPDRGRNGRLDRLLRWSMILNTKNGPDYIRQLNALGAWLGMPDDRGRILLIQDFSSRPVKPQLADMSKIGRIWWTDDRTNSVAEIAKELQLDWKPRLVFAFFPKELEDRLVAKELEYGKRFGRTQESDIGETVFRITFRGGASQISVESQEGKK
jgi:hypothetical protein